MNTLPQTLYEPGESTHEQRLVAIGLVAGGVAHDFNNILCVILGYGERALNNAARGSRLRRDLENIMAAGRRARTLVDQVLTPAHDGPDACTAVDVEALVREALDLLPPGRPETITIESAFEANGAAVLGRTIDVHRVVMNLATNALQAMPDGGTLRVSVTAERVTTPRATTVGSLGAGDYVVLRVADSGNGIAAQDVPRIFDRFFTTRHGRGGTGLGLSLVRHLVMEAGGAIDVTSCVGAGTCFTVHLPRADSAAWQPLVTERHEQEETT